MNHSKIKVIILILFVALQFFTNAQNIISLQDLNWIDSNNTIVDKWIIENPENDFPKTIYNRQENNNEIAFADRDSESILEFKHFRLQREERMNDQKMNWLIANSRNT